MNKRDTISGDFSNTAILFTIQVFLKISVKHYPNIC